MKSTFSILFYLRKTRATDSGHVPIMARITINGERAQFNTKTEIHPDQWDSRTGRCFGKSTEITKTNRVLDAIRVKVTDLYHNHLNDYGYVLPEKIKNIVLGIDTDKKKLLLQYFDEHNEFYLLKIGKDTSQVTYGRYLLTRTRLEEFLKEEYRVSDIPVIELTPIFIERFFLFLQNNKKLNNNSALKFVQRFRTVSRNRSKRSTACCCCSSFGHSLATFRSATKRWEGYP